MRKYKPERERRHDRQTPFMIMLSRCVMIWGRRRATAFVPIRSARRIDKISRL